MIMWTYGNNTSTFIMSEEKEKVWAEVVKSLLQTEGEWSHGMAETI